jgi:hypothetical protein
MAKKKSLSDHSVQAESIRIGPVERDQAIPYPDSAYLLLDKESTAADASVVFRTQGNTRGEIGIPADDDLHIKTVTGTWGSETFTDAIICKNPTGYVQVPQRLGVGTVPTEMFHVGGRVRCAGAERRHPAGSLPAPAGGRCGHHGSARWADEPVPDGAGRCDPRRAAAA